VAHTLASWNFPFSVDSFPSAVNVWIREHNVVQAGLHLTWTAPLFFRAYLDDWLMPSFYALCSDMAICRAHYHIDSLLFDPCVPFNFLLSFLEVILQTFGQICYVSGSMLVALKDKYVSEMYVQWSWGLDMHLTDEWFVMNWISSSMWHIANWYQINCKFWV